MLNFFYVLKLSLLRFPTRALCTQPSESTRWDTDQGVPIQRNGIPSNPEYSFCPLPPVANQTDWPPSRPVTYICTSFRTEHKHEGGGSRGTSWTHLCIPI